MPRIAPALLAGVLAGMVIGPIAAVVVARLAPISPADSSVQASVRASNPSPGIVDVEEPSGASALSSHWLGRIAELTVRFGSPAAAEYFVLERTTGEDVAAVAVVAIRRLDGPDATLLEREIVFEEDGIRVLHTERIEGDMRRLVWREFLPSGTRSWMAEWRASGDRVQTIGYGWHRNVHEWIDGEAGMVGPLELLDRLRRTDAESDVDSVTLFTMIDPTSAAVTNVIARTVDLVAGAERTVEVRRPDGSLVLDAVISEADAADGAEPALSRLRFGEGHIAATPIREGDFHRRRARWKTDRTPAHEAILARIPKRH